MTAISVHRYMSFLILFLVVTTLLSGGRELGIRLGNYIYTLIVYLSVGISFIVGFICELSIAKAKVE